MREVAKVRLDWALVLLLGATVKLLQTARFVRALGVVRDRRQQQRRVAAETAMLRRLERTLRSSDAGSSYTL